VMDGWLDPSRRLTKQTKAKQTDANKIDHRTQAKAYASMLSFARARTHTNRSSGCREADCEQEIEGETPASRPASYCNPTKSWPGFLTCRSWRGEHQRKTIISINSGEQINNVKCLARQSPLVHIYKRNA